MLIMTIKKKIVKQEINKVCYTTISNTFYSYISAKKNSKLSYRITISIKVISLFLYHFKYFINLVVIFPVIYFLRNPMHLTDLYPNLKIADYHL